MVKRVAKVTITFINPDKSEAGRLELAEEARADPIAQLALSPWLQRWLWFQCGIAMYRPLRVQMLIDMAGPVAEGKATDRSLHDQSDEVSPELLQDPSAADYESGGREFESLRARYHFNDLSIALRSRYRHVTERVTKNSRT